ncbi:unnamed protein product, partial [Trichogramma brassicae]
MVLSFNFSAISSKGYRFMMVFKKVHKLERRQQPQLPRSSEELEDLQKLLHFPEEVALRLAESEYQLFSQVPPEEYLRHVLQDLTAAQQRQQQQQQQKYREESEAEQQNFVGPNFTHSSTQTEDKDCWPTSTASVTVQSLIDRFSDVSTWACNVVYHGTTTEERQALLSCLLRVAQTCWNIGNFNSAMEIIAGLKFCKFKIYEFLIAKYAIVSKSEPKGYAGASQISLGFRARSSRVRFPQAPPTLPSASYARDIKLQFILYLYTLLRELEQYLYHMISQKLKGFWTSVNEGNVPVLDFLSSALLSSEYDVALERALSMPECPVVPFFGAFLRELREVISHSSK